MRGFRVFLGKELAEFSGTWRAWALPIVVVALAVMSPVIAKLQPFLGMPTATTVDAYMHFSSNMIHVVLMALVISVASMVSAERRSGTAILMLTKPLSRMGFVLAKVVTKIAVVVVSGLAGALVCWAVAQVFFDNVLFGQLISAMGLWMVLATMMVSLMALFSAQLKSQAGAAGGGFGLYLVLALLTQWAPAREYSPVGLMTLGDALFAGDPASAAWPVGTALAIALVAALAAAALFSRQEI